MLVGLTLWTFFAFVIKLLRGKRTIKFERFDIALLIFMGIYILGGIVSVDTASSCKASMVFVCFMLSYILVVNLVNTTEKLFAVYTECCCPPFWYRLSGFFSM